MTFHRGSPLLIRLCSIAFYYYLFWNWNMLLLAMGENPGLPKIDDEPLAKHVQDHLAFLSFLNENEPSPENHSPSDDLFAKDIDVLKTLTAIKQLNVAINQLNAFTLRKHFSQQ